MGIKKFKTIHKIRTNIGLGVYPATPLKKARDKRVEAMSLLTLDIDPKVHRDKKHIMRQVKLSRIKQL